MRTVARIPCISPMRDENCIGNTVRKLHSAFIVRGDYRVISTFIPIEIRLYLTFLVVDDIEWNISNVLCYSF